MSNSTNSNSSTATGSTSLDDQPRKRLRQDASTAKGMTTRSRQREKDKTKQDNDSMPSSPTASNQMDSQDVPSSCSICFEILSNQEVGIPESCDHAFCLDCIIRWSEKNNTCPIDRKVFREVKKKRSYKDAQHYGVITVTDKQVETDLQVDWELLHDDISCHVCGRQDQEDLLLICDECDNGYHTFCLGLPGLPAQEEWFCPLCELDRMSAAEDLYENSDVDEELQNMLIDDLLGDDHDNIEPAGTNRRNPVPRTARMRTRTRRTRTAAATTTTTTTQRRPRRRRQPRTARNAPVARRQRLRDEQQRRGRRRRIAQAINRLIDTANDQQEGIPVTANRRQPVIRNERPNLGLHNSEPIELEEVNQTSYVPINRRIISTSEAARRIAASGIPIQASRTAERSVTRTSSIRDETPSLDRNPSRTIRPPRPSPRPNPAPTIAISQLPRIQRLPDAPVRPPPSRPSVSRTPSVTSFIDNLLNAQARLHDEGAFRLRGANIEIR